MAPSDAQEPVVVLDARPARRDSASRRPSQDIVHPALEVIDPATKFLYTPHTVTGLLLGKTYSYTGLFSQTAWLPRGLSTSMKVRKSAGILLLVYYSRALNPPAKTADPLQAHQAAYYNLKHGITAACFVFLGAHFAQRLHHMLSRDHANAKQSEPFATCVECQVSSFPTLKAHMDMAARQIPGIFIRLVMQATHSCKGHLPVWYDPIRQSGGSFMA